MRLPATVLVFAALCGCHDWAALSSTWEGDGVCTAYVVAGPSHTCARMSNGALYCWGDNRFGQLGVGDSKPRAGPTRVEFGGLGVSKVYLPAGDGELTSDLGVSTCAITTDNALWCWGGNRYGQLGVGDTELRAAPTRVATLGADVAKASNGGTHTCAQTASGKLWCWGSNLAGQLGLGAVGAQLSPAEVPTVGWTVDRLATGAKFSCARGVDGSLWCWGDNGSGQLGLNDTTARTSPTQVLSLGTRVVRLAAGGAHLCAFTTDGEAWCWGDNRFGELGVGDVAPRPAPARVGNGTFGAVSQVFAGGTHSCALKLDGTLWCWGDNRSGQLGVGDTEAHSVPIQVAPELLGKVAAAYAGGAHTCAVKTDSSVWCWGNNEYGQVGAGAGSRVTAPVQVFPPCSSVSP